MKNLILCLTVCAFSIPSWTCEISQSELVAQERELLRYANQKNITDRLVKPLNCILEIQERSEGLLKYLANSFLRPLMGGPQANGLTQDKRYQKLAAAVAKLDNQQFNPTENSFLSRHAKGVWGFYSSFCNPGNQSGCSDFLPTEDQIAQEGPVLAASSLLLLRQAYLNLNGDQKAAVGARIRKVFERTSGPSLQRKVIEQIHRELFENSLNLSSIS